MEVIAQALTFSAVTFLVWLARAVLVASPETRELERLRVGVTRFTHLKLEATAAAAMKLASGVAYGIGMIFAPSAPTLLATIGVGVVFGIFSIVVVWFLGRIPTEDWTPTTGARVNAMFKVFGYTYFPAIAALPTLAGQI